MISICTRALYCFIHIFRALSCSLCCPRPLSRHPSDLPRSTPGPPSTYFRHHHRSSHTVLIHSLHVFKSSQYSLSHSTRQLASSFLTPTINNTPTKHLNHYISRTFTFLLAALPIPHASALYNAVGTITATYRHFLAFIPNPQLLSTHFSTPHALYHAFIVSHNHFTSSIHCHLPHQVLKTIHFI